MSAKEIPTLVTERLLLRPLRLSDLPDYAALNADPEVLRYYPGDTQPWALERSWRHMAFLLGHWDLGGTGMWAVERREDGAFAGVIGFAEPAGWPGFELAWKLTRRWWGNGYATEGARAALAFAFDFLQRTEVISVIQAENLASIRVAERIGETEQGRTVLRGHESLCYSIDRERYSALSRFCPSPGPVWIEPGAAGRHAGVASLMSASGPSALRQP